MPISDNPAVTGAPRLILQAEGVAVLIAATVAYAMIGGSWLWFAGLFLVPDLFMLGYLIDRRTGAVIYNLGHTYVAALALAALGYYLAMPTVAGIGLIWVAHIGADRMLGFGLKYASGFGATHLSAHAST